MGGRVEDLRDKYPFTINDNVSSVSMLNSVSTTTVNSNPLNWYTTAAQVDQLSDITTTKYRDMIHSFNKIRYNRFLKYTGDITVTCMDYVYHA